VLSCGLAKLFVFQVSSVTLKKLELSSVVSNLMRKHPTAKA